MARDMVTQHHDRSRGWGVGAGAEDKLDVEEGELWSLRGFVLYCGRSLPLCGIDAALDPRAPLTSKHRVPIHEDDVLEK